MSNLCQGFQYGNRKRLYLCAIAGFPWVPSISRWRCAKPIKNSDECRTDKTLLLSTEVFNLKFRKTCGNVQTKSDSLFPLHAFPGQEVEQAAMLHVVGDQPQLRPGSIIFVVSSDESEDVVVPEHAGLVDLDLPHPGLLVQAGEDLHRHVAASPLTTPHLKQMINRCLDLQK